MFRLPHNSSTLPLLGPLKPACQVTGEGPFEPTAVSTWKVQSLPNPPAQAGSIPSSLQEHSDNPQEQRVPSLNSRPSHSQVTSISSWSSSAAISMDLSPGLEADSCHRIPVRSRAGQSPQVCSPPISLPGHVPFF